MKTINLKSLIEIYKKNENDELFLSYEKYLGTKIKKIDLKSLTSLVLTPYNWSKAKVSFC